MQAQWSGLIIAAALTTLPAQIRQVELRCRLLDSHQLPVARASVTWRNTLNGAARSCVTNEEGRCGIMDAEPGDYVVTAKVEGFEQVSRRVLAAGGSRDEIPLNLTPATVRGSVTVVSGSRIEELQEDSPVKVEAITREELQSSGYERISDALAKIPGVVIRRGSTATVGGEMIQGVDSRQVLLLQDGLPIVGGRGIKSGVVNLNRQSVGRLERVEVAKGAGSPLYGSDAIGGVINLITREATNPFEGGLTISGGSIGAVDARGQMGGRFKSLSVLTELESHRQDSYGLLPSSPYTVGPEYRREDLLFKTRYQALPRLALGFTASAYHNRETGRNASETGPVTGLTNDSVQSYAGTIDWTLESSTTLQTRGYLARYDENSSVSPLGTAGPATMANLNERLRRLDTTLSRQWGSRQFFQAGAEWAQTQYRGANRLVGDNAGQQVTTTDYWLQDKIQLVRRLTLTLGGRVTDHSLFGTVAVPKAGLVWRVTDRWIARASWGLGFRAPDLGQLYYRFANPASFYQVIGNPNLRPEHGVSASGGVTYRANRYRLGLSLFRNNIRDLIDSRMAGTPRSGADLAALLAQYGIPYFFDPLIGRQTFVYLNVSRIVTEGVEVDGEWSLFRNFRVAGAYTYVHAEDRLTKLGLTQRHPHQGSVRADYVNRRLGLVANARGAFLSDWLLNAQTGTKGNNYALWDAYVSKDLRRGFQAYAALDNLNNSRDSKLSLAAPTFDRPDYGRTWRAGLRFQFQRGESIR